MSRKQILLLIAWAGLAVSAPAAAAQDSPEPAVAIAAEDELATLDDSELTSLRGGEALVVSNQTLTAITSGNIINGNYTAGNVSLSDHALSSFNGVGNLLINTGGQVSLQTGMNLTINVGE